MIALDLNEHSSANGRRSPSGRARTIAFLRRLTDDGDLNATELTRLVEFVRPGRLESGCWPCNELRDTLAGVSDCGSDGWEQVRHVLGLAEGATSGSAGMDEGAYRLPSPEIRDLKEFTLPQVEKRVKLEPKLEDEGEVEVDMWRHECTSMDCIERQVRFKPGSVQRCCRHLAAAFQELFAGDASSSWTPMQRGFMEDLAFRGRGASSRGEWQVFSADRVPLLFHRCETVRWMVCYAPTEGERYERHAFNRMEKRWSYGCRPCFHRVFEELFGEVSKGSAGSLD